MEVRFDVEFGHFLKNIEDSEKKISEKITRNSNFSHSFSTVFGGEILQFLRLEPVPSGEHVLKKELSSHDTLTTTFLREFYTKTSQMETPQKPEN